MPDVNMSVFEEAKRNQLVTEVDIQTQVALDDYQVQLSDIANPTQSQDNVVIDRHGEFLSHWNESLDFDTWVKMSMEVAGKKLLIIHGNDGLNNMSNGDDTFITFRGTGSGTYFDSLVVSPTNVIFESKLRFSGTDGNPRWGLANTVGLITDDALQISYATSSGLTYLGNYNEGTISAISSGSFLALNTWSNIKIVSSSDTTYGYVDGSEITPSITTQRPDETLGLCSITTGDITIEHEYVFAREYTATEPTYNISTSKNISTALKSLGRAG